MNSCLHCNKQTKNLKYCSRSCAAKLNNKLIPKRKPQVPLEWCCKNCGFEERAECKSKKQKFCSIKCQQNYFYKNRIKNWLEKQISPGLSAQKKFLYESQKNKCLICGISEWNGNSLILELDHINGNANDNSVENLRLLCPNCHSQTPTYKNKNKGNGRASRKKK